MAYTAWSVVYGEQPTAAKWNQLGANDAGFKDGTNIDAGAITASKLAAGAATYDKVDTNMVVQVVEADFSNMLSSNAIIPYDNTIPQIGEGFEVMTASITPKSATNILIVEAVIYGSLNGAGASEFIGALFRDAVANGIGANSVTISGAGYLEVITVRAKVTAGSTSATTFRCRLGSTDGRNVAFNGYASSTAGVGTQVFSSATKSSLKITEVKA